MTGSRELSAEDIKHAYDMMHEKKALFFLDDPNDVQRLTEYIKFDNKEIYHQDKFVYIPHPNDRYLIAAATPDLGCKKSGQVELGLFARKTFYPGDPVITCYGKNLWGTISAQEMQERLAVYENPGDYVWEVDYGNGTKKALDLLLEGNAAKLVNQSFERNTDPVINKNGDIDYIATKVIHVGTEITTTYGRGKNYFDKAHPMIKRKPQQLNDILFQLVAYRLNIHLPYHHLATLSSMKEILSMLGWNEAAYHVIRSDNMEVRNNELRNNIIDLKTTTAEVTAIQDTRPPIFDLDKLDEIERKTIFAGNFIKTSKKKFFVASKQQDPLHFALFTGQYIKKKKTVCKIKGEEYSNEQLKKLGAIDNSLVFNLPTGRNIFCQFMGSEALFIQGTTKKMANVEFAIKNNIPIYRATKDISPGSEIVAYYQGKYITKPMTLNEVVDYYNQKVTSWKVTLHRAATEPYLYSMEMKGIETSQPVILAREPYIEQVDKEQLLAFEQMIDKSIGFALSHPHLLASIDWDNLKNTKPSQEKSDRTMEMQNKRILTNNLSTHFQPIKKQAKTTVFQLSMNQEVSLQRP